MQTRSQTFSHARSRSVGSPNALPPGTDLTPSPSTSKSAYLGLANDAGFTNPFSPSLATNASNFNTVTSQSSENITSTPSPKTNSTVTGLPRTALLLNNSPNNFIKQEKNPSTSIYQPPFHVETHDSTSSPAILSLEQHISRLNDDLSSAALSGNFSALSALTSQINSCYEAIKTLRLSLPNSQETPAFKPNSKTSESDIARTLRELPSFLHGADAISDPNEFLEKFLAIAFTYGIPASIYYRLFLHCFRDAPNVREYFVTCVYPLSVEWTYIKSAFLSHYQTPGYATSQILTLHSMSMQPRENIRAFTDRFLRIVARTNTIDKNIYAPLLETKFNRAIQGMIRHCRATSPQLPLLTIDSLVQFAISIDTSDLYPSQRQDTSSPLTKKIPSELQTCKIHGQTYHSDKDCKAQQTLQTFGLVALETIITPFVQRNLELKSILFNRILLRLPRRSMNKLSEILN